MQTYLDLVMRAWLVLNGRKKKSDGVHLQFFGIAAILQGLGCWLIAEFFIYFSSERVEVGTNSFKTGVGFGSGLVGAILIYIFLSYADRGKSLSSLAWFGEYLGKWQEQRSQDFGLSQHYNNLAINLVILCKTLCFAALVSRGHSFWVLYAVALSSAAVVVGLSHLELILKADAPDIDVFTVVGLFVIVSCVFHNHFIPAVLGIIAAFLISRYIFRLFLEKFEYMNEQLVKAQGEIIQCVLLLLGLFIIR